MSVPSALMFPAWMPGRRAAPEGVLRSRFSDHTTSSAVTGLPSWNTAPLAILNVHVFRSLDESHDAASLGTVFSSVPGTARVSKTRARIR